MSFSNDATIHITFSQQFTHHTSLSTAIDRISYSGGGTQTAIALTKAYEDMFRAKNGARKTGTVKYQMPQFFFPWLFEVLKREPTKDVS